MPKLTRKLPSYRLHKVSGHAIVTLGGRDHYLGPHGSPESLDAYKGLISEWTAAVPVAAAANLSRRVVNGRVNRIRRVFN